MEESNSMRLSRMPSWRNTGQLNRGLPSDRPKTNSKKVASRKQRNHQPRTNKRGWLKNKNQALDGKQNKIAKTGRPEYMTETKTMQHTDESKKQYDSL